MPTDRANQQLRDFERDQQRHTEDTQRRLQQQPDVNKESNRPSTPKPASPDKGNEVKK